MEGDPAKGDPVISKEGEGVVVIAFFLPLSLLTGPKPVCIYIGSVAIAFVLVKSTLKSAVDGRVCVEVEGVFDGRP